MTLSHTRWAAIGAAVAVAVGAGGIGLVNASVSTGARTVCPNYTVPGDGHQVGLAGRSQVIATRSR
jgi:hypothetical protein